MIVYVYFWMMWGEEDYSLSEYLLEQECLWAHDL